MLRAFRTIIFLTAVGGEAEEVRLMMPEGRAAAGSQVSIVGVPGSIRADREGRITIPKTVKPPVTLVIIGARGEIFPPVTIEEFAGTPRLIRLEPALREVMTVTSGVAPNIEAPPAAGTTVIGREDLEERKPEHLAETLGRTPGVEIRGEGPAAVPVLRGLAGGRTLILYDDARVTTERRAGPSATFLDPFTLGSIEISRGPGSVAYGSDALGGVIHARPRDPVHGDPGLLYEAQTSFGGRSMQSAGIEVTRDVAGGALLAAVHARDAGDQEAGGGERILNSSFSDRGAAIRFASTPTQAGIVRAAILVNEASDVGAPAADVLATRTYYPAEKSHRLTASWTATPPRFLSIAEIHTSLGSYDTITHRERLPNAGITRQIMSADVRANDASIRITGTRITGNGRLHTGLDFVSRFNLRAVGETRAFDASDRPTTRSSELSIDDARKRDSGAFVIYDWSVSPQWTVGGGARIDRIATANRGGFFGSRSRRDTALSGHAAATYAPVGGFTASIQAASGYRDPSLSDRYFRGVSGRGFAIGNPDLDPERSLQFDGVMRWHRGARSFALLAYHYRIRDLVERFRAGNDFTFRNRGEAKIRGIEIEMSSPLGRGLSLQANATVARGEALDDHAPLDDIPAPHAHAGLHWASTRASAFVYGFVYGEDDRPGPVEAPRPGYATFDAGAGWRFSDAVEIRINTRNLADRRYAGSADANASVAPGRSISVAIGGRL